MLSRDEQIQIIADIRAGLVDVGRMDGDLVEQFKEPWKAGLMFMLNAGLDGGAEDGKRADDALRSAWAARQDKQQLMGIVVEAAPGQTWEYPTCEELYKTITPIAQWWRQWIAKGVLTGVFASGGIGKSYWGLDLARRFLHGELFPDNSPMPDIGLNKVVLYIEGEYTPQITLPRAVAMGINLKQMHMMLPNTDNMIDFGNSLWCDELIKMTNRLRPGLIILDSLSTVNSRGQNNVEDVRPILAFFRHLAIDADCVFMMHHHVRKEQVFRSTDFIDVDDGSGSGHIAHMCRTVVGIAPVRYDGKKDDHLRTIGVVKTNIGEFPQRLTFKFTSIPDNPDYAVLAYGDLSSLDPDVAEAKKSELDRCLTWLERYLEVNGATERSVVIDEGDTVGFSSATLDRAAKRLGFVRPGTKR